MSLLPAIFSLLIFSGFQAFRILVVAAASAVLTEMGARKLFKKKATLYDGSALLTALLLALLLPPSLPSWEAALGSAFAIFFGKEIFGGLGENPFNPALAGAAFLWAAFPSSLTAFSGLLPVHAALFLAPLLWGGGIFLLIRRLIRWEVPLFYLGSVFLFSMVLGRREEIFFSGPLLLAAFYLVTDPVTTPLTRPGERWFAFGSGLLTAAIREKTSLTEGMTYGILMMNALTPWLDHWFRPRPWVK